ncbi:MAG: DUF1830 domain-containing protein [Phormidesmis sp.]
MHLLEAAQKILCGYTNPTARIQIVRISNIPNYTFERSVIPNGSILFETFRDARLEIHTSDMISAILSDVIPCTQLTVQAETQKQRSLLAQQSA